MIQDYKWDFPLNDYNDAKFKRKTEVEKKLEEVREWRIANQSTKKQEEVKLVETKFSTMAFAGA